MPRDESKSSPIDTNIGIQNEYYTNMRLLDSLNTIYDFFEYSPTKHQLSESSSTSEFSAYSNITVSLICCRVFSPEQLAPIKRGFPRNLVCFQNWFRCMRNSRGAWKPNGKLHEAKRMRFLPHTSWCSKVCIRHKVYLFRVFSMNHPKEISNIVFNISSEKKIFIFVIIISTAINHILSRRKIVQVQAISIRSPPLGHGLW